MRLRSLVEKPSGNLEIRRQSDWRDIDRITAVGDLGSRAKKAERGFGDTLASAPGPASTGTQHAQMLPPTIAFRLIRVVCIKPGGNMSWKTLCAVAAITSGFLASDARGEGSQSLFVLSDRYRVAVDRFEETVRSVRGIDRGDERLVDRLDDASARMRLAAKNPRHLNRLLHRWRDVQKLHAEVEATIFGKYTPNHDLVQTWNLVSYHYILFAEEYFYQIENPGHDGSVRRIPESSARRNSYLSENPITPLNVTRLPSGTILIPQLQESPMDADPPK